ncbi:hypothetical protein [Parvularcula maris]|uniref:Uncharacterized protein n=1 Tax=Parvularcula maris TaxID=2965077 RepID=A0A9X2LA58_9PROT|nr:hypothetical protein [Parvularcula maris]MCQ8185980.1 hypothetical protein [Parvularcula maris]
MPTAFRPIDPPVREASGLALSGEVVVPLDAPPLLKLAEHLRAYGLVAVAFPGHVLVLFGGRDGCCGLNAEIRIRTFSEARGLLRGVAPMPLTAA